MHPEFGGAVEELEDDNDSEPVEEELTLKELEDDIELMLSDDTLEFGVDELLTREKELLLKNELIGVEELLLQDELLIDEDDELQLYDETSSTPSLPPA